MSVRPSSVEITLERGYTILCNRAIVLHIWFRNYDFYANKFVSVLTDLLTRFCARAITFSRYLAHTAEIFIKLDILTFKVLEKCTKKLIGHSRLAFNNHESNIDLFLRPCLYYQLQSIEQNMYVLL